MPRRVMRFTPAVLLSRLKPGISATKSSKLSARTRSRKSPESTVSDIGMSVSASSRFWAVTMISSTARSLSWACAAGASARVVRTAAPLMAAMMESNVRMMMSPVGVLSRNAPPASVSVGGSSMVTTGPGKALVRDGRKNVQKRRLRSGRIRAAPLPGRAAAGAAECPRERRRVLVTDDAADLGDAVPVVLQEKAGGLDAFLDAVLHQRGAVHGLETGLQPRLRDAQLPGEFRYGRRVGVFHAQYPPGLADLLGERTVQVQRPAVGQGAAGLQYLHADAQEFVELGAYPFAEQRTADGQVEAGPDRLTVPVFQEEHPLTGLAVLAIQYFPEPARVFFPRFRQALHERGQGAVDRHMANLHAGLRYAVGGLLPGYRRDHQRGTEVVDVLPLAEKLRALHRGDELERDEVAYRIAYRDRAVQHRLVDLDHAVGVDAVAEQALDPQGVRDVDEIAVGRGFERRQPLCVEEQRAELRVRQLREVELLADFNHLLIAVVHGAPQAAAGGELPTLHIMVAKRPNPQMTRRAMMPGHTVCRGRDR